MSSQTSTEQYNLSELLTTLWHGKWIIIGSFMSASVLSVWLALSLPNIYKAEALLSSNYTNASGMGKLSGNLGGLASLAGVNLGGGESTDKTQLAIEVMRSRDFFAAFDAQYDIMPLLLGIEKWDRDSKTLHFDPLVYDEANKTWVRDPTPPYQVIPSVQEGHAVFIEMLNIEHDKQTSFTQLSFEHESPYVAQQVVERLIANINSSIRNKDIEKAERSIAYLRQEIASSDITELQSGLFDLIQVQIEKVMLANANPEYVFQVIDPPLVPELKAKPKRALICVVGAFLGALIGLFIVLLRNLIRN